MKKAILFILISFPFIGWGQNAKLYVGENPVTLKSEQTQTEVKPGWKIVDIQLKSKSVKYFWGKQSQQLTDNPKPTFVILPKENETLVDYAIMRLKQKRQYRTLYSAKLYENNYIRMEPKHFHIKVLDDMSFECRPLNDLEKGEYILIHLAQKPIGELQDYVAYPFRVQ
jgi:hypothetical protein